MKKTVTNKNTRVKKVGGIAKILNNYNIEEYLIIGDSLKSDVGFAMKCNFDSC